MGSLSTEAAVLACQGRGLVAPFLLQAVAAGAAGLAGAAGDGQGEQVFQVRARVRAPQMSSAHVATQELYLRLFRAPFFTKFCCGKVTRINWIVCCSWYRPVPVCPHWSRFVTLVSCNGLSRFVQLPLVTPRHFSSRPVTPPVTPCLAVITPGHGMSRRVRPCTFPPESGDFQTQQTRVRPKAELSTSAIGSITRTEGLQSLQPLLICHSHSSSLTLSDGPAIVNTPQRRREEAEPACVNAACWPVEFCGSDHDVALGCL